MQDHLLPTYTRLPVHFDHGSGAYLYDEAGNEYLDAYCGIAVTGLGHNYPAVTKVIQEQATKILHASNLVEIPEQAALSDILASLAGMDAKVFFNNSGAEAVETALKLARLYGHSKNIASPKIIVMEGSFHGRTIATISAGDSAKSKEGFEPLLSGFVRVKYNDIASIEAAVKIDKDIVAVLLEPIQGESGVRIPDADYLQKVRSFCDAHKILMLVDEVQAGMGRTGKFFCFEHSNILPDAIMLAKGLANGLPIAACIIREPYCDLFTPGSHGSTFGGNPLCCAASIATVQAISTPKVLANAAAQGAKILAGLQKALQNNPNVTQVRGLGLLIGVELASPCREIMLTALKHKIVLNVTRLNVLRITPPLIINDQQAQAMIDIIPKVIEEYYSS